MTIDSFQSSKVSLCDPANHAEMITPSDTATLDYATRAIYVGEAGDLRVKTLGGEIVTYSNVPVGHHPIRVIRVYATDTTASGLVGER